MPQPRPFRTIRLERTSCLGICPVYKLTIEHTGKVTFHGFAHVDTIGVLNCVLDTKTLTKLNEAIAKYDYFNIKRLANSETMIMCTCMPNCISSIEMMDGQKRTISHYLDDDCDIWPRVLWRFERRLERIVSIKDFVGETHTL